MVIAAPDHGAPATVRFHRLLTLLGDGQARFGFAPTDPRGEWSTDDIYIEPYGKG
jgi:hypothetical protein